MDLAGQYQQQLNWRNWESLIKKLPLKKEDLIVDLGCGAGFTTKLISNNAKYVIGIDNDPALLNYALQNNSSENIQYLKHDLNDLESSGIQVMDGIWSSFVAAYFPDFKGILHKWLKFLKDGGWIALTEITDLFGHEPLDEEMCEIIEQYYLRQRTNNIYDFEMGKRLKWNLINMGLSVIHEEEIEDPELNFNGPASEEILSSWNFRFERMYKFKEYLGKDLFIRFKESFLKCLSRADHVSTARVKFIIAVKK